jgi:hypothetical protein
MTNKGADISKMMADVRKLADAGDEDGCIRKVSELKDAMSAK